MATDYIVETQGLSIDFNGFYAVKNVDLKIARGSIHALIGPNGAGKTTCFNLITRFLRPTAGKILFNGKDITRTQPADIARLGVVRSFQISATFPHLTVLENVRIALQRKLGTSFFFWKSENSLNELNDRARELLEQVGLIEYANLQAVELSYGR
ncbi:MAG: ABC transporter ATP-binding protein, partial [Burkholderiales bacterium]